MRLTYGLEAHGWATVTLECSQQTVRMAASYLHDSLRDLASAARAVAMGAAEVKVIFMDEPGEHELIIRRTGEGTVEIEVVWYEGWKSWGMYSGTGQRRLLATTSIAHVRGQVFSELTRLLREYGEDGYRERWGEHGFPLSEMRDLERAG
jgi:hypothetical protein